MFQKYHSCKLHYKTKWFFIRPINSNNSQTFWTISTYFANKQNEQYANRWLKLYSSIPSIAAKLNTFHIKIKYLKFCDHQCKRHEIRGKFSFE